jgi:SapC
MATDPSENGLPLFYNDILPLNRNDHATWKAKSIDNSSFFAKQHAIPLTTDEFIAASRSYPILFSAGENPVPLALMGLHEGTNIFVDEDGKLRQNVYVPAYIRRYPFLLAKLQPDSEELSLCFDPTSGAMGETEEGEPLFVGDEPAPLIKDILQFCEQFEEAGQRTQMFVEELKKADLLMDGEASIQADGQDQPYIYRGFRMIDEDKVRDMRGDTLRKMTQNGMLPLIYAHLFSLQLMKDVFAQQSQLGLVPAPQPVPANA